VPAQAPDRQVNLKKLSPKLIIGILLFVFFSASVIIRIVLPYSQVFEGQWIKETSVDGYYYMRLVDNMVHNFPHYTSFDPYHIFPGGREIHLLGFFYQILAFFIWMIGLGHPSQHLVDVAGTLFAPILAGLTIIPVYFIGKTLFNRWVGVIAAGLMAILPGEYLGRSILGFADTPIVETFFTTVAVAFLMLAIKTAAERKLSVNHILKHQREVCLRPVIYSLLAGLFLGFYMVTWAGALLFVFIIAFYLVVQFIIDHLAGRSTEYLGIVGFVVFLVNFLIYLPVSLQMYIVMANVIAVIIPVGMAALSFYLAHRGLKPAYYPLSVIGLAVVLVGIMFGISSGTFEIMMSTFRVFAPRGSSAITTMEMQPFLSPQGTFSTAVAWGNFTTSFFLVPGWPIPGFAFVSFIILVYVYVRRRREDRILSLFLIWTVIMLVLTLVQRRFAYYFVVNVALLSAYLSWSAIWQWSLKKLKERRPEPPEEPKSKKQHRKRRQETNLGNYRVFTGLTAAAVFLVVFLPNIVKADQVASAPAYAPSDAWEESLTWMRDNTPEPLGSPDAYYGLYNDTFVYPASAYGVTSWWDYGYWITRIGRRLPNANPSQDPGSVTKVAGLFLAVDNATAENYTRDLQTGYLVADYATTTTKFWAIVIWSGQDLDKYRPTFYFQQGNSLVPAQAYSLDYYRTAIVRLYNFGGKAVTSVKPVVLTYTPKVDSSGNSYRLATETKQFDDYQAALDYVKQGANRVIVGTNPFISPIPLEAVPGFTQVHGSTQGINTQGAGSIPEVRIFKHIPL
jgi:oligosaccharyl transferase (archaeosortase A-associated)